ncbi:MAG: metallopeptidase family protein [Tissierellia bacterium]|nr:metallopeptidase family protein [Tissierellia bacterium]
MRNFPDIDRVQEMLDEIAMGLPKEFFDGLNNGIVLIEEEKFHPETMMNLSKLNIMGEYVREITGNSIRIYYGSFKRLYEGSPEAYIKLRLEDTLLHEFRHHLEHRAGVNDLILEDKRNMERYRERWER